MMEETYNDLVDCLDLIIVLIGKSKEFLMLIDELIDYVNGINDEGAVEVIYLMRTVLENYLDTMWNTVRDTQSKMKDLE